MTIEKLLDKKPEPEKDFDYKTKLVFNDGTAKVFRLPTLSEDGSAGNQLSAELDQI